MAVEMAINRETTRTVSSVQKMKCARPPYMHINYTTCQKINQSNDELDNSKGEPSAIDGINDGLTESRGRLRTKLRATGFPTTLHACLLTLAH